jgi:RNA polymerase sigma factor (sigma-70 family)
MQMADGPPLERFSAEDYPAGNPSDGELMARSVAEPECFAVLFDRHAPAVHRYLGRRVGELADDLLGETFLIAFRRRAAYRAMHLEVRPWLIGIATYVVQGHVRTEQRRYRALSRTPIDPPTPPEDPDTLSDRLAAQALRGPLAAALAGLKDRDRDVLLLFAWAQLTYEEIADVLDVPVGTVRSRLNRARRQTRAALDAASPFEDLR